MFHKRISLWAKLRLRILWELPRQLAQNPFRPADGELQKTRDILRSETLRSLKKMQLQEIQVPKKVLLMLQCRIEMHRALWLYRLLEPRLWGPPWSRLKISQPPLTRPIQDGGWDKGVIIQFSVALYQSPSLLYRIIQKFNNISNKTDICSKFL